MTPSSAWFKEKVQAEIAAAERRHDDGHDTARAVLDAYTVPGLTRKTVGPKELIRTGEIEPAVGHYGNGVCAGAAASGPNDD